MDDTSRSESHERTQPPDLPSLLAELDSLSSAWTIRSFQDYLHRDPATLRAREEALLVAVRATIASGALTEENTEQLHAALRSYANDIADPHIVRTIEDILRSY